MISEASFLHSGLEKKPTVLVKPSKQTPQEVLSLSTLDNDPVNQSMAKTIHVYRASDDNDGKDPASLLEEALAMALVYYYPFAGKVRRRSCDGRLELICNGDGVPFITATAACSLSDVNYLAAALNQKTMAECLLPDYDVSRGCDECYHPLALQVTRFSCGGFTVGTASAHTVCDGTGAAQFFQALAELASGRSEPAVEPVWERERLLARDEDGATNHDQFLNVEAPVLGSSPHMPTADTVTEIVSVTAGSIKALKTMLTKESEDTISPCTTFEVLSAYVWKSRTRALEIKPDETTLLDVVFGVRNILDPPLPQGYYGSAILDMVIPLTRIEIDELPLYEIVKLIKKAKKRVCNNGFVQGEIRNVERRLKANVKTFEEDEGGAVMMVTDWRNLGLVNRVADFGWKQAVDLIPVVPPDDIKLCIFLSPSRAESAAVEGGARVLLTLPWAAMPRFKQEMEALNELQIGDT